MRSPRSYGQTYCVLLSVTPISVEPTCTGRFAQVVSHGRVPRQKPWCFEQNGHGRLPTREEGMKVVRCSTGASRGQGRRFLVPIEPRTKCTRVLSFRYPAAVPPPYLIPTKGLKSVTPLLDEYSAFTDGRGGCQTVAGRRKDFGAVSLPAVHSPYNKRTRESELWGIWAFRPDAKSISYVLST